MSCRSPLSLSFLLLLALVGCSEAETPDARFDAGPRVVPGLDGGPGFGSRDEPCASGNRCESGDLVCVNETQPNGENESFCRLVCDQEATDDPCGDGSTCGRLQDDRGACLPAGGLDEECPCDDGFACTLLPSGDGGTDAICKQACPFADDDGGVTNPGDLEDCPAGQTCTRLQGSDGLGVCIED